MVPILRGRKYYKSFIGPCQNEMSALRWEDMTKQEPRPSQGKADRAWLLAIEAGLLKRIKRTGWWYAGIKDPESVADHSLRMSQLAFYLATEEGADPFRAATMGVFHDLPETRMSDANAVVKRYWEHLADDEARAREEQLEGLPEGMKKTVASLYQEWEAGTTPEARCARDADYLECALQAAEYLWQEKSVCLEWLDSNTKKLTTATGKALGARLRELLASGDWEQFRNWWKPIYRR